MPVSQPSGGRSPTTSTSPAGPRRSSRWTSVLGSRGYLVKMPFQEGEEVKAGDLLFVIDPRPYKAQLDQAQGQVDLYQASLKLARTTLARDRAINSLSPGSVSQQQFDQEQAVVDEAEAQGRRPTRRAWRSPGSTTSSPGSSRRSTARSAATT